MKKEAHQCFKSFLSIDIGNSNDKDFIRQIPKLFYEEENLDLSKQVEEEESSPKG